MDIIQLDSWKDKSNISISNCKSRFGIAESGFIVLKKELELIFACGIVDAVLNSSNTKRLYPGLATGR